MTVRVVALLVLVAALAVPADAAACTCIAQDERELREQADVVFTGRVTAISDPRAGAPIISSGDPVTATFAVLSVSKGRASDRTFTAGSCDGSVRLRADAAPRVRGRRPRANVVSARSSATCGLGSRVGEVWRIYGRRARPEDLPTARDATGGVPPVAAAAFGAGGALGVLVLLAARRRRRR